MAVEKKGKITAKNGLRVHPVPKVKSAITKVYPYGTEVIIIDEAKDGTDLMYKTKDGWIFAGWVQIIQSDVKNNIKDQSGTTIADKDKVDTIVRNLDYNPDKASEERYKTELGRLYDDASTRATRLKRYTLVHGLPFQFNRLTDRRYKTSNGEDEYGRIYAREIISNSPIAIFVPGVPKFLTGWTVGNAERNQMISLLRETEGSNDELVDNFLKDIGSKQLEYFSFTSAYREYMEYVNTLCRSSAILMGIGDYDYMGKKLKNFDWKAVNADPERSKTFEQVIGLDDAVAFAYEPMSGIGESVSNSTSDSALTGILKGVSDKAREAEFLFGAGAGIELQYASDEYIEQLIPKFNDFKKYNPNSTISRIALYGKTLATGANVRFPEIWRDSNYSKGYNIDLKFVSPYGDAFSKWRYVLVPFWHVLALAGPRSVTPNTYQSPFLIRAFSKGYFNCELGMIDSISFKKFGDGDAIAEDGIPTEIEISVSFKDLYTALALTKFKDTAAFFNNSGLIDMIGTTSGVNVNRKTILSKIELWLNSKVNVALDMPGNFMQRTQEILRNRLSPIVGK